jgi:hypothetical protein
MTDQAPDVPKKDDADTNGWGSMKEAGRLIGTYSIIFKPTTCNMNMRTSSSSPHDEKMLMMK